MSEKRTETTEIIKDEKGNIIKETKTIVIEKETIIEKQDYIPYPCPQPYIQPTSPYTPWYEPWYRNHLTISGGDNASWATTTDNDDIFTIY